MLSHRFAAALCACLLLPVSVLAQSDPADDFSTLTPGNPDAIWSGTGGMAVLPGSDSWTENTLPEDGTIWSGTLQFERTGRLLDPIELGFVDGFPRTAPIGMPVYARTLTLGSRRNQLAWCAIADTDTDDLLAAPTACLIRAGRDRVAVRTMDSADTALTMPVPSDSRRNRERPAIAEVEGLFGPLYVESLRYAGLVNGRVAIDTVRRNGEIEAVTHTRFLALDDQGRAIVRRSGGAWQITPAAEPDGSAQIEMLAAPLPQADYLEAFRAYLEFMVARTGSLDFMLNHPMEPSLVDMQANGFVPGESTLDQARDLREADLADRQQQTAGLEGRSNFVTGPAANHMLLEITDAPIRAEQGVMTRGDVIAIHTLRAREAITIDTPMEGISRDFEAGSVFGLLALGSEPNADQAPEAPQRRAWCDMTPDDRFFATSNRNCFMDRNGDGALDYAVMAQPRLGRAAVTLGRLMEQRDMEPHPYRAADPGTHPLGEFGYQYCEGDNIAGPARFAPVYRAPGEDDWPSDARCSLGVWPDASDPSRVDAGALQLEITPAAEGLAYAVVTRLPAEPVYVGGSGDAPLPISTLGTRREENRARVESLRVQPLIADGPLSLEAGRYEGRAAFATLPVRYGATGRLMNEVRQASGWVRDDPLPVGTPVFGIPMGNHALNANMTWCAPRREESGWDTVCFPTIGATTYWMEPSRTFYTASLRFPADTSRASPPEVDRAETDLGYELRIEVFMLEWDRQDVDVQVRLCGRSPDGHEACDSHREVNATRTVDGSAEVMVYGHRLRLSQPEDGDRHSVQVDILETPEDGVDATRTGNPITAALAPIRG